MMDPNVALENTVRIALFKNRGDVLAVAAQLNLSVKDVKKIRDDIKKKTDADVSLHVADSIMGFFVDGYMQRVGWLSEALHKITAGQQVLLSPCCKVPVGTKLKADKSKKKKKTKKKSSASDATVYVCLKCDEVCTPYITSDGAAYNWFFRAIDELRTEDQHMIDGALKLGFMGENVPQPPPVLKQNNVFLMEEMSDGERAVLRELEELDPIERQGLRLKLEQKLLSEPVEQEVELEEVTKEAAKRIKTKVATKRKK